MRATEEKEVEGPESEHARERENELEREYEEEMPALEAEQQADAVREGRAIDAMRAILEKRQIVVNDLKLPKRQLEALEALKAAVNGRDGDLNQFVYASDRQTMLEQALGILQPELVRNVDSVFADLVQRIGILRVELHQLVDAQDDLVEANQEVGHELGAADTADKPKPDPGDTSLDGPERVVKKPPTSLTGPELKEAPPAPTTLLGPAIDEPKRPPSTLGGPDLKEPPPPPSTLDGPEVKLAAKGPTTLGDEQDIAKAGETIAEPQKQKTKPWWRRAFGSKD